MRHVDVRRVGGLIGLGDRVHVNIVHGHRLGIGISDEQFLPGLNRQNLRRIKAVFLIQHHGRRRGVGGFASNVFQNDDDVTHNVFSTSKGNEFDIRVQRPGGSTSVTFLQEGTVEVQCAIHPKMKMLITVIR